MWAFLFARLDERQARMDGEANGSQETQQGAQEQNEAQEHGSEQGQQAQQGVREVSARRL